MNALALNRPRGLALSSGSVEALKWIALLAMVVDHVNAVFFARELGTWATVTGRVAMPLFAMVLGYNLARPRADLGAGLRRLLVFGVLSVPVHSYLFAQLGGWWPLNIMFTFAVAVAVILLVERGEFWLAAGLFVVAGALVEYWWPGVALVVAAWFWARRPDWIGELAVVLSLWALCLINGNWWSFVAWPLALSVAWWAPHVPRCGRFFWWFYPAHLAVLALASRG